TLYEPTNPRPRSDLTLFEQVRAGVLAYLHYDEEHPHGAWAAYMGMGCSDPILQGFEHVDTDRQAYLIVTRIHDAVVAQLDSNVELELRTSVYGWLAFAFDMC